MARFTAAGRRLLSLLAAGCGLAILVAGEVADAAGSQGFDTVVIDAGHGGIDRGGGPGQAIPEKPYTLDTAFRLQRALERQGVRTVMTRTEDVFVPLAQRVMIGGSHGDAIFVSIHYNSAPREGAHGVETYYYGSDSYGLAERLHRAQLRSLDSDDRNVRRRGFFVLRRSRVPAVLCEGGYLTNGQESQTIINPEYRERWAQNVADAIVAQQRYGDPVDLGNQPPITTEHLGGFHASGRRHRGGHHRTSSHHHGTARHGTAHHGATSHRHSRRHSRR